ncbi:MAG: tRNA adenosine(34) deaminase TadA [Candidatus Eisenbacteria sp.]|nr:tRNA adenosine(34) deaminase TadA [Candidatus Eisenbacteria bacterium]
MRAALAEARRATDEGEVPVGCVIVDEARIIGRGRNRVETLQDPTAHAEILAISAAAEARGSWRLSGTTAYVTVEPCTMCMGAFHQARVARVVFGAAEPKFGACGSRLDLTAIRGLNHTLQVEAGVLAAEAAELMRGFFRSLRAASGPGDTPRT